MPLDNIWDLAISHAQNIEKEENQQKDCVMLVLGSRNGGKTTICNKFVEKNDVPKPTIALDYSFARRSKSIDTDKDVCHIWELGNGTVFLDLLSIPITEKSLLNLNLVLIVDLSVPNELWIILETLLNAVKNEINTILQKSMNKDLKQKLEMNIQARLENCVEKPENPFPVPLLIIGTKYDLFQDIESEKRRLICKCLRYVALFHGASLLFTSYRVDNQMNKVRLALSHMVFKTPPNKSPNFDYNKPLLVPLGTDSVDSIGPLPDPISNSRSINIMSLGNVKECFISIFPQVENKELLPDDPGRDPHFKEKEIDILRNQKNQELEQYRKSRKQKAPSWE